MVQLHSSELEISPFLSFEDCKQDWLVIGYHQPYPYVTWLIIGYHHPYPYATLLQKDTILSFFCLPTFVEGDYIKIGSSSNLPGKETARTLYQLFVSGHLLKETIKFGSSPSLSLSLFFLKYYLNSIDNEYHVVKAIISLFSKLMLYTNPLTIDSLTNSVDPDDILLYAALGSAVAQC